MCSGRSLQHVKKDCKINERRKQILRWSTPHLSKWKWCHLSAHCRYLGRCSRWLHFGSYKWYRSTFDFQRSALPRNSHSRCSYLVPHFAIFCNSTNIRISTDSNSRVFEGFVVWVDPGALNLYIVAIDPITPNAFWDCNAVDEALQTWSTLKIRSKSNVVSIIVHSDKFLPLGFAYTHCRCIITSLTGDGDVLELQPYDGWC